MSETSDSYLGSLFGLAGRVGVVTGGGRGLGRAMAVGLAGAGSKVVVADIDAASAAETAELIARRGGASTSYAVDASTREGVDSLFRHVDEQYGRVDILINNAAVNEVAQAPEAYPLDAWDRTLRVNLTGPFLCAQAAAWQMIDRGGGGSIVNIGSINGTTASGRGLLAYDVSKAGVNHLTRCLAVEWAVHGIRVNAIQPCQFNPGWHERLNDPQHARLVATVLRGIPLGRVGEPEEIVGPAIFLASDAASMITGVCLPVDGGNLATNAGAGGVWPEYGQTGEANVAG